MTEEQSEGPEERGEEPPESPVTGSVPSDTSQVAKDPVFLNLLTTDLSVFLPRLTFPKPPQLPVLTDALNQVSPWGKLFSEVQNQITSSLFASLFRDIALPTTDFSKVFGEAAKTLGSLGDRWREALPSNWRDEESVKDVTEIMDLMKDTGWCLVWCPRNEIIQDLLNSRTAASGRTRRFLAHQAPILEDISESLALVESADLKPSRNALMRAVRATEDGHNAAGQALAASCLSGLVGIVLQLNFKAAKSQLAGDPYQESIFRFRAQMVFNMVADCFAAYWPNQGDPIPTRFNRHASAHTASPRQFTKANALGSLLLVNAFIRELDLAVTS